MTASELIGDKMGGWIKVVGCVDICKENLMVDDDHTTAIIIQHRCGTIAHAPLVQFRSVKDHQMLRCLQARTY